MALKKSTFLVREVRSFGQKPLSSDLPIMHTFKKCSVRAGRVAQVGEYRVS